MNTKAKPSTYLCKLFRVKLADGRITTVSLDPKPTQNAYIKSFNGKFRDECRNEQWFESLHQARQEVNRWRRDYNEVRPHSAIGRIPPAQFAAAHRRLASDAQHQPEIQ